MLKIDTPIVDFVENYKKSGASRFHMPGHKGVGKLGIEALDITEISGADSLYEANGIIKQSEQNATRLFGSKKTVFSTEGSSLCIRTMLYLALLRHKENNGGRPTVIAGRNAHKSFIYSAAVLDFDITWLYSQAESFSLCSCKISPKAVEESLRTSENKPMAVYITTPDYLGNIADVAGIAAVCKAFDVPLIVDNAHGAYLSFIKEKQHPILLGADMCCDSAHKTLPVLTGGAYLHISKSADDSFANNVKQAMAIFGSTSPSYLILQSLDLANKQLSDSFSQKLERAAQKTASLKKKLAEKGFCLVGDEPLKITVFATKIGYSGHFLAEYLHTKGVVVEYFDTDFVVLMTGANLSDNDYNLLFDTLCELEIKPSIQKVLKPIKPIKTCSVKSAVLSPFEKVNIEKSLGKTVSLPNASCPPAIPVVVSGETVDSAAIEILKYYNVEDLYVIK